MGSVPSVLEGCRDGVVPRAPRSGGRGHGGGGNYSGRSPTWALLMAPFLLVPAHQNVPHEEGARAGSVAHRVFVNQSLPVGGMQEATPKAVMANL